MNGIRFQAWFLTADPRRAAAEVGWLAFALMLPLAIVFAGANEETRSSVLVLGAMEIGLVCGLIAAFRMRPIAVEWRQALPREVAAGIWPALAAGIGVILTGPASLVWPAPTGGSGDPWPRVATIAVFGGIAAAATFIAYIVGRGVARALPVWDRMRRSRLRWALTHALLVGSLSIAVVIATLLTLADFSGNFAMSRPAASGLEMDGTVETVIALVTTRFIPSAIALFLLSVTVGIIIVPPGALIAFPVLGRATRRLEDLAQATAALRAGELHARSPVSGEDEVAHLQADFNAMAADLERALRDLRAERDAVSRLLDDRRQLIAAASHELRTPVATLRGYLESALTHWADAPPPALRHDLAIMAGETQRLHRLIDDLFTLSRAEVGQLSITLHPTAVDALLRRSAEAAAPLAWERGRVEVLARPADDLPLAMADSARLEQVVRNLVANAVRHTPPGGMVLMTADAEDEIVIQVKDTGEGIIAADLPFIWDRFFRSTTVHDGTLEREASREGAGLGLALVKDLTEAMGGTVAVESAPGKGSCFTVRLPVARVSADLLTARG